MATSTTAQLRSECKSAQVAKEELEVECQSLRAECDHEKALRVQLEARHSETDRKSLCSVWTWGGGGFMSEKEDKHTSTFFTHGYGFRL